MQSCAEEQAGPSTGNDPVDDLPNEGNADLLKCHLCGLFFTNEANKTCHFKQKYTTKLSCSYQNCMAKFYKQTSLDNHKNCTP